MENFLKLPNVFCMGDSLMKLVWVDDRITIRISEASDKPALVDFLVNMALWNSVEIHFLTNKSCALLMTI